MSLLEASHLCKSFNSHVAVDDLSFHVDEGEIFGLLGPNGAGKSTAMLMVAGLRRPDSGQVTISGHQWSENNYLIPSLLGVVPQDLAIYPDLTARENLDFFGRLYNFRGAELARRIDRVLDQIGLVPHADDYVSTFSGGMKRRLNFGVALIHGPKLVILDEPTVGVDPQSRSHLLDCIRQLGASGVGVIYASHYMEEVEALCHRVAIIDHGRLLKSGTLSELLNHGQSDQVLRVAAPSDTVRERLSGIAHVVAAGENESHVVMNRVRGEKPALASERLEKALRILREAGANLLSIETREHNLEMLFLELTGRKLRD